MDHKYKYYIAGGKTLDAVRAWQKELHLSDAAIDQLKSEFGAKGMVRRGERIAGLIFEGEAPAGWRSEWGAGSKFHFPYRKTKADKAIWAKFSAINIPTARAFSTLLGLGAHGVMTQSASGLGFTMHYPVFETLADERVIVSIPASDSGDPEKEFIPPDCEPLKVSEYFALKEADEAAKPESAQS